MTRNTKRTPELIKEVGHFYYDQKLSIKEVAKRLNIERTMTLEILNQNLNGSRTPKEAAILRIKKYGNPKLTPIQLDYLRDRIRARGFKEEWKKQISLKNRGEGNKRAKLTEQLVLAIRNEYEEAIKEGRQKTATQFELAEKYNIKRPTVSDIVLFKKWKHI
jgi:transcriptional regulator with XRE-family HTH domain